MDQPLPSRLATPPTTPRRRWWVGGLFLLLCVLGLIGAGGASLLYASELIIPGPHTLGVPLGSQTRLQAQTALQQDWDQRRIILTGDGRSQTVAPADLGISLNVAATVNQAYLVGRSFASLQQWQQAGQRIPITPIWQIDMTLAEANLRQLSQQFATPPRNADLTLVNGEIQITPAQNGRRVDLDATLTQLATEAATAVLQGEFDLIMMPDHPRITDVTPAVAEIERILTTAVAIQAYDPILDETLTWTLTPAIWNPWVTLQVNNIAPVQLDWDVDTVALSRFVDSQLATLGDYRTIERVGLIADLQTALRQQQTVIRRRVTYQPRPHVVQSGETFASIGRAYGIPYPWIQNVNPGISDALYVGQTVTIPSPDDLLPLPIIENKRIIVSISQQRMWAYENGQLQWEWATSTGIDDSPTAPGVFQVQSHEREAYAGNWDLWMPYFIGIYQPVPTSEFMNGFHGFPTRDGRNLLWTNSLGRKVTYGCVLVSNDNAAALFDWAEKGVIVEIQQ